MTSNNLLFLKERTQVVPAAKGTPEYDHIIKILENHEKDDNNDDEEEESEEEEQFVEVLDTENHKGDTQRDELLT